MHRVSIVFCVCILLAFMIAPAAAQDVVWPTDGWQTATPESQGMDSGQLADMLEQINQTGLPIHSVLVIRNGYLVLESYQFPYTADMLHQINSATKSFTSALVGIAMAQGYIKSVDQPMLDFFPDYTVANLDAAKQSITLENLLTMSSGLDWSTAVLERPTFDEMRLSKDWIQFVLDRPMKYEPGQFFIYNSGGSHLLAAIVAQATGQPLLDFARTNLLEPLGIQNIRWETDPQGRNNGGRGIEMTPRDMAKFGYLYLHNGEWDGQQIIPADWVTASTSKHIPARNYADGYGYQWWVDLNGYAFAAGAAGQQIIVDQQHNLVVVFTSNLSGEKELQLGKLFRDMILPAVQSDTPLPENPTGEAALQAARDARELSTPVAVPALNETATRISGKTYTLELNDYSWKSLTLTFTEGSETAQLAVDSDNPFTLEIGMDNLLRVNPFPDSAPIFAKGKWETEKRFGMEWIYGGSVNEAHLAFTFDGQDLKLVVRDTFSGNIYTLKGSTS